MKIYLDNSLITGKPACLRDKCTNNFRIDKLVLYPSIVYLI